MRDAAFVASMEHVLDCYQCPLDPEFPVVNMDEQPGQLKADLWDPQPMQPGQVERVDSEYKRKGVVSLFLFTEALSGWRKVSVRERRTAVDSAEEVKALLEEVYPDAERVILKRCIVPSVEIVLNLRFSLRDECNFKLKRIA